MRGGGVASRRSVLLACGAMEPLDFALFVRLFVCCCGGDLQDVGVVENCLWRPQPQLPLPTGERVALTSRRVRLVEPLSLLLPAACTAHVLTRGPL